MVHRPSILLSLLSIFALIQSGPAHAVSPGECSGGVCGTPKQSGGGGGGCGCGGGSILINNTDEGQTYQYADDYDDDGIEDDFDNCPFVKNKSQADSDGDGIGNSCDICPSAANKPQLDTDGDGMGDVCDQDDDNDGHLDIKDNCPLMANLEQYDTDKDSQGDACDQDDDNDGHLDVKDNCPLVYNPQQEPPEQLGNPKCDTDLDLDLVPDSKDNCPMVANGDQKDLDGDQLGDLCDTDLDGDGRVNLNDNCISVANEDQSDVDRDGKGDQCDSRFCFVVNGDEKNCLDPAGTFKAYSPLMRVVTGEAARLRLFTNRKNAPIRYRWIVTNRPAGSTTTVDNPQGSVRVSTPYEYHYIRGNVATFTADEPGEYQIKLEADLVFPDTVNPDFPRQSSFVVTVIAEGEAMGGCSVGSRGAPVFPLLALLAALGLLLIRRRR